MGRQAHDLSGAGTYFLKSRWRGGGRLTALRADRSCCLGRGPGGLLQISISLFLNYQLLKWLRLFLRAVVYRAGEILDFVTRTLQKHQGFCLGHGPTLGSCLGRRPKVKILT